MGVIAWIIIGLIAGWLAHVILGGRGGFLGNIAVGPICTSCLISGAT